MTDRNAELFAHTPVSRAVLALAVPTVISQLITVVYNAADTFFIGQLGDPDQVAAATLSMPVFMFLTAFANLFGIGGAGAISRCLGVAMGGILNILLDPVFIFLCKMQITGAAAATALSNTAAASYFFIFLWKIRKNTVITPNPALWSAGERIPAEVLGGGLPAFIMTLMSTVSNMVLNHLIAGYSNEAVAGIGIAKKIDLVAYAVAQGMTQGALPLVAYNYAAGNKARMRKAILTALAYSLGVACAGALALFAGAKAITGCFISNAETVAFGQHFLRIICLACPTTALNFMIITVFQATNQNAQALVLSFLRKGSIDVALMLLLDLFVGISGIAWATPLADATALCIALCLFLPYLSKSKAGL